MKNTIPFLENAIQNNFQFSPTFRGSLSNHLPMISYCLFDLNRKYGVNNTKISEEYIKKLDPTENLVSDLNISRLNLKHKKLILGDVRFLCEWEKYFYQGICNAIDEIKFINDTIKFLSEGLISGALGHAFLRIISVLRGKEYLSEVTYRTELAKSFAYAATSYFPLYLDNVNEQMTGKMNIVSFLQKDKGFSKELSDSLSHISYATSKGRLVKNESEFIDKVKLIDTSFNYMDILKYSSKIAVKTPNFVLLHVITVGHSLWYLEKTFPCFYQEDLRKYYAHFVLYAYLAENLTGVSEEGNLNGHVTKDSLLSKFDSLQDDHSLKSLFALLELFDATGEQCFLDAANSFIKSYG